MSGVAGILLKDASAVVEADERGAMVNSLRHRGPDGITSWFGGAEFLVHAHLGNEGFATHTLDNGDCDLKLVGDIRLDNRDDISRKLGLQNSRRMDDATLVLNAYQRWGSKCCEEFVGDFVFAIWDQRERSLFCVRDQFGVRPLFYKETSSAFCFASEAKVISGEDHIFFDEFRISAFLSGLPFCPDETSYKGVYRLHAGHCLTWRDGRTTISKYWELQPEQSEFRDAAAEFRDRFMLSVQDRLYGTDQVASMLSGGLDSSAITAVAARHLEKKGGQPLNTYSLIYPNQPSVDERQYIQAVLKEGSYSAHNLAIDRFAPLGLIEQIFEEQEGPYNAPGLLKARNLYRKAADDGMKVILDGHGGDEVVSYGTGRIMELASNGNWLSVASLLTTHCELSGEDPFETLLFLFALNGSKSLPKRIFRRLGVQISALRGSGDTKFQPAWQHYLKKDFMERTELIDRFRNAIGLSRDQRSSDFEIHRKTLMSPLISVTFEILDKASIGAGVQVRYPFFDTRLATFCLGLPSSEKLRRGETRSIMRRAMKGIYPDEVLRRKDKTDFSPELAIGLVDHHGSVLDDMVEDRCGILEQFLDRRKLGIGIEELRRNPNSIRGDRVMFYWRVASLYLWSKKQIKS